MSRFARSLLLAMLLLLVGVGGLMGDDRGVDSDTIIPIASGIKEDRIEIDVNGQKLRLNIAYAQQGNTVFILPVWYVREVSRGPRSANLKPSDPIFLPESKGDQVLEFDVVNLLEPEDSEAAIQQKLKARIAQRNGTTADNLTLTFASPQIRPQSYRFTLITSGRGDAKLPAELPISAESPRLPNGRLRLTLDRAALAAAEQENRGPLSLTQAYLRCTGEMRVRFEQSQVFAQIGYVRASLAELRKQLSSLKDSNGRTPEAFVELPGGGAVDSEGTITQMASQSLQVTISARSGTNTAPILTLVQAELQSILDQQRISVSEENKLVAVLLDRQVAVSATMGEIHRLANASETAREEAFKEMMNDYKRRAENQSNSSDYSGSLSLNIVKIPVGVGLSGRAASSESEAREAIDHNQRENEIIRKGFDRLMREFNGRMPTLSGIAFDDKTLATSFEKASRSFEQRRLTTGNTLHRWPLIPLSGQLDTSLDSEDLVRSYAILKADYETLMKIVGTPAQVAEARENFDRLAKLNAELTRKQAELDKALSDFKAAGKEKLAQYDNARLKQLENELISLRRKVAARTPLTLMGHSDTVTSATFRPDGTRLVSTSFDKTLKIWDAATGQELRTLKGHTGGVWSAVFSPDGTRIVSCSVDKTLKIWDAATGKELRTLKGHTELVIGVAYSPDGTRIVSGSFDKTLKIWDAATGQELRTLIGHSDYVSSVAYSLDGKRIVSGSRDQTLKIWDAATGQELHTLIGHSEYVNSVAYSLDGKRIVSGSKDETLKIWDAETGQELRTLKGHASGVWSAVFSPDGTRIVSGSRDQTLKIWDAGTGHELHTLNGHTSIVSRAILSPDGTRIVSGSWDKTLKIWDVDGLD